MSQSRRIEGRDVKVGWGKNALIEAGEGRIVLGVSRTGVGGNGERK